MSDAPVPSGLIPDHLLKEIRQRDCVLFFGADLPLDYEHAPLSRPELAAALAEEYDLPRGLSWAETAQAYLGKYRHDRHTLVEFIARHNGSPPARPGDIHQAIAAAGFQAIVSAWYDDLLEQALQGRGYRVHRVARDRQLPYAGSGEGEVIVVKLYGCLSDLESLVITPWDINRLLADLPLKLKFISAFCNIKPLLFANHDLRDPVLQQLYVHASRDIVEDMRRAYAVWPAPDEVVRAAWQGVNLELVDRQPTPFLQALAGQLPGGAASVEPRRRVRRPPYKFLDYYQSADADIFCGRDTERQIVARLALSRRLLTLFGPSGAGKTSLLLAGVAPRLAGENYQHVYVRALDEPRRAVRKAVAARAGREDFQAGADLRAFFSAMLAKDDRLVVILDQFEELFLRVGVPYRRDFFKELAAALSEAEREVRVIFSLREDYLANLDEARPYLPDIFANSFRLAALDRSHARVAVTEPAARAGVAVEPALVDALVGGEGRPGGLEGDLVEQDGRVPPPALQIVLDRLYRQALPAGFDPQAAPPPGVRLTLEAYRQVRCCLGEGAAQQELRGAPAILASYLDDGLAMLPVLLDERGQPRPADATLGWEMLKALVTSRRSKAALALDELERLLDESGAVQRGDQADERRMQDTRLGLAQVRLVRSFERDGQPYYELAHDHLAAAIAARLSQEELGGKVARELLRPALDSRRAAGVLMSLEALKIVDAYRDDLRRLSGEELELLLRSALAAGCEAAYWFERAAAGGVAVAAIALEGLKVEDYRGRAAAVDALGKLLMEKSEIPQISDFWGALLGCLADEYPQVRVAAMRALEGLQPSGEWRAHLKYECYVPAGEFVMGDKSVDSHERPPHRVSLEAFYVGKYPVTNVEYGRFMQARGKPFEVPQGKEHHPVVNVTWYEARQYAHWAGMRLLTEAEWEKAASWELEVRNGKVEGRKLEYPWGYEFDKNRCNTSEAGIGTTTPVGRYSPEGDSPWGCADMAGNVWEWTSSLERAYPYRAEDGREDAASGASRVQRGGSFDRSGAASARCAARFASGPYYDWLSNGFRAGWGAPLPGS